MMARFIRRLLVEDKGGATAIELCILTALISVAIIASLHTFSNQLNNTFAAASSKIAITP
ncbi:MAG: Flp family type IVb pilin [Novosphingobium sp. PASSN1]|nr:MAG: Flp family type IVb pilin [Novosphingobium sp. PASSN1]